MAKRKIVKIHNKSDKPDNIVSKEYEIDRKSKSIEETLPTFWVDSFSICVEMFYR